ncbi:riboflavin kinase [Cardiosporidium cionae]|uniref:riboflavin kinase n=1 Tax=Cardiosporidium cionae TaxID=476202 RepID=A0ABQ7J848_9APIC|nr:riboflavin kinase [Cardiosporidium cionae]|eukprot:KAF8820140.1 riboflavin kinase [Cardiosporidium cionae]
MTQQIIALVEVDRLLFDVHSVAISLLQSLLPSSWKPMHVKNAIFDSITVDLLSIFHVVYRFLYTNFPATSLEYALTATNQNDPTASIDSVSPLDLSLTCIKNNNINTFPVEDEATEEWTKSLPYYGKITGDFVNQTANSSFRLLSKSNSTTTERKTTSGNAIIDEEKSFETKLVDGQTNLFCEECHSQYNEKSIAFQTDKFDEALTNLSLEAQHIFLKFKEVFPHIVNISKPKVGAVRFCNNLRRKQAKILLLSANFSAMHSLLHMHKDLFDDSFILKDIGMPLSDYLTPIELEHALIISSTVPFAERMLHYGAKKFLQKQASHALEGKKQSFLPPFSSSTRNNTDALSLLLTFSITETMLLDSVEELDWPMPLLGDAFNEPISYPSKVKPSLTMTFPCSWDLWAWRFSLRLETPFIIEGKIVPGFGRGSTLLGIPTANVESLGSISPFHLPGVYYGYAGITNKDDSSFLIKKDIRMHKMVMSMGYNPFFENTVLSIEPHIFYSFPEEILGKFIRIKVIGLLRCESDFIRLGHLIQAIQWDCEIAKEVTENVEISTISNDDF